MFAGYVVTRPQPVPNLRIRLAGEGDGQVLVTKVGDNAPLLRCSNIQPTFEELGYIDAKTDPAVIGLVAHAVDLVRDRRTARCEVQLPPGTRVKLTAVLGDEATFGGYHQLPMRTPEELVPYLGDPLAKCSGAGADLVEVAKSGNTMECTFTIQADTELAAEFGNVPKEIDVALAPSLDDVIKPIAPPTPLAKIDAEKLDEKPLDVALAPPPKVQPPPPIPPPPPPKPEPQEQKKPVQPPPPNMVMVEVKDDKNVKDKAPDDATKLSDKNRDVDEETRAKETNLEKESEGKEVASKESDDRTSKEIGGPDDKIRQLQETDKTTDKRDKETDESGKDDKAKGVIVGEGGEKGDDSAGSQKDPGLLAMRGIEGRGSLAEQGKDGKKAGKKGLPGVNSPLAFQDYERIMGKEKIDEERQVAARKMSSKKGRWERKLDAVKSSLENFVPDVRPGNQTALKTRAHPFALYIARMHRRIHELWGFGFLEQLDDKPANDPLNNPDLWVNLEVAVNADGTVHKVTIAKTSGKTEFDVAAVDTVLSAAPYEPTPEAIRSVNGKVYLRWGFYRNWRQCGTFNVEPYILTDVPDDGGQGLDDGAMVRNTAKLPGKKHKDAPMGDKPVTPDDGRSKERVSPATSVTDQQALFAANLWVSAFATASVDKLVKYSTVPFSAGGKVAASTGAELKEMYSGLIVESGPMKDWKLLTPSEYGSGSGALPEGNLVLQVRTAKETFAVVLTRTKSGDYRATQIAR
ncbi:MAG TPA: TonB family protein [Kofleriaceae bacterium]|nr:TonB family protein [Kofleriaceae bacterium]